MLRDSSRGPRESFAERRARRAEIEDPALVLDAALRFLEARQRSVAEVRRRLTSAGYREDLVTAAIERLGELAMLDDKGFARAWVESRDRAHPRGERALRRELALRGVDRATIAAVLDQRTADAIEDTDAGGAAADDAAARRLLARHAAALGRITDPRRRRERAYALLARNGFDAETCRAVAAGVTATDEADAADEDAPRVPDD